MSPAPGATKGSASNAALAEASVWIARLYGPGRNEAVESAWRDWFGADLDHKMAWEVVSEKWNKSHGIPVGLVHPPVRIRRPSRFRFRHWIISLSPLGAVGLAALIYFYLTDGVVRTSVGEQKTLNLQDGTRIELNTDTRLGLRYDEEKRVVELKSGEAYFSVAHERRPFVVLVENRKVIAVGTSFTVRRNPSADDLMTVMLIEGRVALAPVGEPNVLPSKMVPEVTLLKAGERAHVRRHDPILIDSPAIDRVTGWMRGQLIFDHTPLAEAAAELNRYSDSRLSLRSSDIGHIPVSGTFRTGDSVSFAHAAAETYTLTLERRGSELVLWRPRDTIPPKE